MMSRFVEIVLILVSFCVTNSVACDEKSEFQCRIDKICIHKSKVCDGGLLRIGGGWTTDCPDGSDEENCNYAEMIEPSRRIVCRMWISGRASIAGYIHIEDPEMCNQWDCWWENATSTCYRKYGELTATNNMKCKYCYHTLTVDNKMKVNCPTDKQGENCNVALARYKNDPAAGDVRAQRCMKVGVDFRCATAYMCSTIPDAHCCGNTQYCDPVFLTGPPKNPKEEEFDGSSSMRVDLIIYLFAIISTLMLT